MSTDAPEATDLQALPSRPNHKTVDRMPEGHREFMLIFGKQPGFWEGWADAAKGKPFRPEYETASYSWQQFYENARETVAHAKARHLPLPSWQVRNRPSRRLWPVVQSVSTGLPYTGTAA